MASSSSAPQFLSAASRPYAVSQIQTNLRLLGFGSSSDGGGDEASAARVLSDPLLFQHSDPSAFQQTTYFLFATLDPARCQTYFRSCWPLVEKKQEAEFRKKVFAWYKELQTEPNSPLPMVNVSLLQTPGGKKFVNFVQEFSQFVLRKQIEKLRREDDETLLAQPPATLAKSFPSLETLRAAEAAYAMAVSKNAKACSTYEADVAAAVAEAERFIDESAEEYRELKGDCEAAEKGRNELLREETLDSLRSDCERLKTEVDGLQSDLGPHLASIRHSLDLIASVVEESDSSRAQVLDIGSILGLGLAGSSDSAGECLAKLFSAAASRLADVAEAAADRAEGDRLCVEQVRDETERVERHYQSMTEKRAELKEKSISDVRASLKHLSGSIGNKLAATDPESTTKFACDKLPQPSDWSTFLQEVFHVDEAKAKDSLTYRSLRARSRPKEKAAPALSKAASEAASPKLHLNRVLRRPETDAYGFVAMNDDEDDDLLQQSSGAAVSSAPTFSLDLPASVSQTSAASLSDVSAIVFQAPVLPPHQAPKNISINETKMSAFSPILSSSRMEQRKPLEPLEASTATTASDPSLGLVSRLDNLISTLCAGGGPGDATWDDDGEDGENLSGLLLKSPDFSFNTES